jgi:hypothetical protein
MTAVDIGFPRGSSDEKELLIQWLQYVRGGVLRKVDGITDDQARWAPDGRLIPLLGILNHLTRLEWRWMDGGFEDATVGHDESEFHPGPELRLEQAVANYRARAAKTDDMIRTIPLTQIGSDWAQNHDLRFVVLHIIEETARHAGHADATRELLDGTTGL